MKFSGGNNDEIRHTNKKPHRSETSSEAVVNQIRRAAQRRPKT